MDENGAIGRTRCMRRCQEMGPLHKLKWSFTAIIGGLCLVYLCVQLTLSDTNTIMQLNMRTTFPKKLNSYIKSWFSQDGATSYKDINILWYNRPGWVPTIDVLNKGLNAHCPRINCNFTDDRANLSKHSAVLFSIQDGLNPKDPQLLRKNRNQYQPWVFFHAESPLHIHPRWFKNEQWLNSMNWSMSYRFNSEINFQYVRFVPRKIVQKNFSEIFRKKDKFAAWIVSNCNTQSKRDIYIKKLQEFGVPIDVFGKCSKNPISKNTTFVNEILESRYKFYLSFENSICMDYITEKFYGHYDVDTIMVVRGGADYTKIVPNGTYINTRDFPTIKDLSQFLIQLNASEPLYTEYLKRRNAFPYSARGQMYRLFQSHCDVCKMSRNPDKYAKQYKDIYSHVFHDTCKDPVDIK